QRKMLLELLLRDVEALDEITGRNLCLRVVAALVEEVGEQRLQNREAFRRDRGRGALDRLFVVPVRLGGEAPRLLLVPLADEPQRARKLTAKLLGLARNRAPVLAQHPRTEECQARVLGHEDSVLDPAAAAVGALHPPRGVAADFDPGFADRIADLPGRAAAVLVDVELRR